MAGVEGGSFVNKLWSKIHYLDCFSLVLLFTFNLIVKICQKQVQCFIWKRLFDHWLLPTVPHWAFLLSVLWELWCYSCFCRENKEQNKRSAYTCKVKRVTECTQSRRTELRRQMSHLIEWPLGTTISIFPLSHVCKITVSSPVHNLSGRKLPQQTGQQQVCYQRLASRWPLVHYLSLKKKCYRCKLPINQSSCSVQLQRETVRLVQQFCCMTWMFPCCPEVKKLRFATTEGFIEYLQAIYLTTWNFSNPCKEKL